MGVLFPVPNGPNIHSKVTSIDAHHNARTLFDFCYRSWIGMAWCPYTAYLIHSVMEYCSTLIIDMLREDAFILYSFQYRVHRLVCGDSCDCSSLPDLRTFRDQTVSQDCTLYFTYFMISAHRFLLMVHYVYLMLTFRWINDFSPLWRFFEGCFCIERITFKLFTCSSKFSFSDLLIP